ncbi:MAG TPA: GAF domain-containing protein [Lentzea sp.]
MPADRSQNLEGMLEDAQAVYREFAEPHRGASPLRTSLPRMLDGALSLTGADFGNVQLLDPVSGSLRIVTQFGFGERFLDHFAVVRDDNSACGRAAAQHAQVVIADVREDPGFVPHAEIAAASGFRSVQSTPLVTPSGQLVGMISTHFQQPHRPPEHDLLMMKQYARSVGQSIGESLGVPGEDSVLFGLVRRLTAAGLSVASARSFVRGGPADERLLVASEEIDDLIRYVRTVLSDRIEDQVAGL